MLCTVLSSGMLTTRHQAMVLALVHEEPLQDISTVVVLSLGGVVSPASRTRGKSRTRSRIRSHSQVGQEDEKPAVSEHPLHICYEQSLVDVIVGLQPLCHGLHVH